MNLTSFKTMRVTLSSSAANVVRLRISGSDVATQNNGCYPVCYTKVSASLQTTPCSSRNSCRM